MKPLAILLIYLSLVTLLHAKNRLTWIDETNGKVAKQALPATLVKQIKQELENDQIGWKLFQPNPIIGAPEIAINVYGDDKQVHQLLVFKNHVVWNGKIAECKSLAQLLKTYRKKANKMLQSSR